MSDDEKAVVDVVDNVAVKSTETETHPFDDQFSPELLAEREALFALFDELKLNVTKHWHPVANTVEELLVAVKDVEGIVCKNLFTKAKRKGE
jgi:hypothetical protein